MDMEDIKIEETLPQGDIIMIRKCPVCVKPLVECEGCYDDADLGE
jgi:uncharacterized Zn finger protein (UPF0148 family)